MSSHPGPLTRLTAFGRDWAFRISRRLAKRYSDVELRQLRSLERAYGSSKPPELLVFGDSAMFWTLRTDDDRRHLVEMIRDNLSPELRWEALVGPGYNPRIILAFLAGLERCSGRPRVVIVPASVLMASTLWLAHPYYGYEVPAGDMLRAIEAGERPRRLARPADEDYEELDRLPAPSLFGARRTVGEIRLMTNSKPQTRWQGVVRLRHLMDHYNAERLEADSPGLRLVAEMGAKLRELGLPSVAYIPPINHEVVAKALGKGAVEHVERNAGLVEAAFLEGAGADGRVVNAVFDSPAGEYMDPIHLTQQGRERLGRRIADAVRPLLEERT